MHGSALADFCTRVAVATNDAPKMTEGHAPLAEMEDIELKKKKEKEKPAEVVSTIYLFIFIIGNKEGPLKVQKDTFETPNTHTHTQMHAQRDRNAVNIEQHDLRVFFDCKLFKCY